MNAVPVEKLNELLDEYRDVAIGLGRAGDFWLNLAVLVGAYEKDEEDV